jgi:hypothetical protein
LRDLGAASAAGRAEIRPGVLSLVVIPNTSTAMPQPSLELLGIVNDYLQARRLPAGRIVLLGPRYGAASVTAEVVVRPGCSPHAVVGECEKALARFLHPVHGSSDGRGWVSSRRPHRSMLIALLARVDGVSVVRRLDLQLSDDFGALLVVAAGAIVVKVAE